MGTLVLLPTHEDYPYPLYRQKQKNQGIQGGLDTPDSFVRTTPLSSSSPKETATPPQDRQQLRQYILTHSLKGAKMFKTRTPFIGQVETVPSPEDPDIEFGIKRVGNREVMIHRDRNAAVRYIQRDTANGEEFISEKDYPVGSMTLDTVSLCLASWNIADEKGQVVPINRDTIQDYTSPVELNFLYEKIHEFNPVLSGKTEQKNDSGNS